jgi:hypothetical protein
MYKREKSEVKCSVGKRGSTQIAILKVIPDPFFKAVLKPF